MLFVRYMMVIPAVSASPIKFHTTQEPTHITNNLNNIEENLSTVLKDAIQPYHKLKVSQQLYCPEARLIQYDCGAYSHS